MEEEEEEERLLSELRVCWCAAHFLRPSVRPCFSNNKRRPPPSLPSINNTPSLLSLFLLSQSKGEAVAPLLTYPKIPIAQPKKGGGTVGRGKRGEEEEEVRKTGIEARLSSSSGWTHRKALCLCRLLGDIKAGLFQRQGKERRALKPLFLSF